jgi:predicted  nucleic acid-binding Zn-ribbon protein
MKRFKCAWCKRYYMGYPNNGLPLINGQVCSGCNVHVIKERLKGLCYGK